MRLGRPTPLLSTIVVSVALLASVPPSVPIADAAPGTPKGSTVPASGRSREIHAVSAVSPTDAWAVGQLTQEGRVDWRPLILHWDGAAWSRVPSPGPGTHGELSGVSAISGDDAWAVGSYVGTGGQVTLIEHWDGIRWRTVPSPSPGQRDNWLSGVSAVSGRLAWAVGTYVVRRPFASRRTRTLIEQWDGKKWSLVASPNPGVAHNTLLGVAGDSRSDAWAVGSYSFAPRSGRLVTLALHWDGTGWSQAPSPNPGGRQDVFTSVAATSSTHAWAVGAYRGEGKGRQTLIARWNGSEWSQVWSPNPGPTLNHLYGVSAVSPTDVWAVGDYVATRGTGGQLPRTLILHFQRGGWTQMAIPGPGGFGTLTGVSADSSTDAWAVGYAPLLRWNGKRWSTFEAP